MVIKMQMICFKFWFVAALLLLLAGDGFCRTAPKADLAWPESDGNKAEIYYNAYRDGHWLGKMQITNNQYNNMHPKIVITADDTVFLVWTALNGMKNKLFYSMKTDGSWTYPKEIETGLKSSIGPSIVLDPKGTPWIAWAGYNGVADDIYVSFWNGTNWSKPQQVNPPDKVPDILPVISLSENKSLVVTWQGYDGERYQYYQSIRHNKAWGKPMLVPQDSIVATDTSSAKPNLLKAKNKSTSEQIDIPLPESFHPIRRDERLYDLKIR
jgi:hypothetical protein